MSEPFILMKRSFFHIEKWMKKDPLLTAGFTTKHGGVSRGSYESFNMGLHVNDIESFVIENRQRLAKQLQFPLEKWVQGEQVHDVVIHVIDDQTENKETILKGVDGLITNKRDVLCTAVFADCVPLYFFDPVTKYIGIAHAGWKGTVKGIGEKMVKRFIELGVKREDLMVTIGPCISTENYEVDQQVLQHIPAHYQEKTVFPQKNGRYLLDLKQLNIEIFLQSGLLRTNIVVTNYCTYKNADLFFSHRRELGKTGRMLGFIGYH